MKNPLALIEDEKIAHEEKLRKMNEDMEDVFKRKVDEKQDRMRRLQRDEESRLEKEKKMLEEEKVNLNLFCCFSIIELESEQNIVLFFKANINSKREELESEKKTWASNHGIEMSKFLARSTESLDGKRKKYTLPNNPFKFGRS